MLGKLLSNSRTLLSKQPKRSFAVLSHDHPEKSASQVLFVILFNTKLLFFFEIINNSLLK